jgi:hypothetical protein
MENAQRGAAGSHLVDARNVSGLQTGHEVMGEGREVRQAIW